MTTQCNLPLINIKKKTPGIYSTCVFFFSRSHVSENIDEWQKMYDSKEPHNFPLPEELNNTFSELQKMIVLRCLRPDKVK